MEVGKEEPKEETVREEIAGITEEGLEREDKSDMNSEEKDEDDR